ncbi:MAG: hypothetical protein ACLQLG_18805 [Thermoguttaceae bacterium]
MTLIEQAILASVGEEDAGGCRVVAASAGLRADDRRELAAWGPSCDGLWEPDAGRRTSINFHPLPSGSFCISRTTLAGWEDGGRVPRRASTHCLVVAAAGLRPFANNPLALVEEAAAAGAFDAPAYAPAALQPLQLDGGAPVVDAALLEEVAGRLGPERLAMLVQAALESVCLAVAGQPPVHQLVAAVLNCLPLECRGEFSFSTELRFASRRPFRIIGLPRGRAEREWLAHHPNVTLLDLDQSCPSGAALGGWARFIERVAGRGDFDFLAAQLAQPRPALALGDLPALGLQLCDELDLSPLERGDPNVAAEGPGEPGGNALRAHAAHHRFEKSAEAATAVRSAGAVPSKDLATESPEVLETLEALDDAVYDAIHGHAAALERLQALWPSALAHLGEQFLAESRVQYLRYALTVWENCVDAHGVHDPARAVQALDVLCMLFDEQP